MKNVLVSKLKPNPLNPRSISEPNLQKLVKSIKEFPEMLKARPIVVNKEMVVLGGNMRLQALQEAGIEKVDVQVVSWTKQQEQQFIIKDNVSFGQWDWDVLHQDWNSKNLQNWGLDIWLNDDDVDLDAYFEKSSMEHDNAQEKTKFKVVLEYTEEEHGKVLSRLSKIASTPATAVWQLLNIEE